MGNETNNFSSMGTVEIENNNKYSLRVVLVEEDKAMHSLWLPPQEDGLYRFEGDDEASIPILITAENGNYYASIAGNGAFYFEENRPVGKRVTIENQSFVKAVVDGQSYVIYAEFETELDRVFVPYYFEQRTRISIGRLADREIIYSNSRVSRRHADLVWANDRWNIVDNESKNGVYVNGRKIPVNVTNAPGSKEVLWPLFVGDVVYIVGLTMIIGIGFISINNAGNRITMNTPKIRPVLSRSDIAFSKCPENVDDQYFNRQPRRRKLLKPDSIEIENPPFPMSDGKIPLLLRLGNPLISGGRAIATGNYLGAVSSLILPGITQALTEKDRKDYEAKRNVVYREYLQIKEKEIKTELERLTIKCQV